MEIFLVRVGKVRRAGLRVDDDMLLMLTSAALCGSLLL